MNSGQFPKGLVPWNKGTKGVMKPNSGTFTKGQVANEAHGQWKGDAASYTAKHQWAKRHFGSPSLCEHCRTTDAKRFEWANRSGQYIRDRSDWLRLCASCHHKMDDLYRRGWATRRAKARAAQCV